MDIGAFVPLGPINANHEFLGMLGPALTERGFESVWLPEHVVLFDEYDSEYPYAETGRFPGGGDTGLVDPLTALAFLAAGTQDLRLGTAICLVPQRNPVYTAKQVADIDLMSGGRMELGIGVGWLEEEYEALNVPFERRGARCDEYLDVMKALWTEDPSSYEGEVYPLRECRMFPKPVQDPHPPILVGGESDAALRRVVRHGQGWFTFNRLPDHTLDERLDRLHAMLDEHDRPRTEVTLTVCPYFNPIDAEALEAYAARGVDRVVVVAIGFDRDGMLAMLDDLNARVVAPASDL